MIGGPLLETWLVLQPLWEAVERSPASVVRGLVRRRKELEQEWSRAVRFIPRQVMDLRFDGTVVLQETAASVLVRGMDGVGHWRPVAAAPAPALGPPPDCMYEDCQPSTGGARQIYRRRIMACDSEIADIVPVARKRRRDDSCQDQCSGGDSGGKASCGPADPTHTCLVIGINHHQLHDTVLLFQMDGVHGLYDDHRLWPTDSPDRYQTIVFADSSTAQTLTDWLDGVRMDWEKVDEAGLAVGNECDVTLSIDSLDFSGPALSRSHGRATRTQRAAMKPRVGSTRYRLLETFGHPVYTWEALAARLPGEARLAGVDRVTRPDLYVQHKPSEALAIQLLDANLWVGRRSVVAEGLVAQALLDGFFVRVVS
jgi:hypothetical protein